MAYKSVLTALTDTEQSTSLLPHAISFATARDAHLDVLCLGIDHSQRGYAYGGINALILQEALFHFFNIAHGKAQAIEAAATEVLMRDATRFGTGSGVVHMADLGRRFAERARFADLVVLSKPYGDGKGLEYEALIEGAMFQGHAPVLVAPEGADLSTLPRKVLVAWNESNEAMRAVKAALPVLQQATEVRIAVIDPPQHGPNRSDPGGPLAQMLSRQGVSCKIDVLGKSMTRVSDVLMRHQKDVGSDMIVMGAYGHSRLREAILGGATRNMLQHTAVPVFMAHS